MYPDVVVHPLIRRQLLFAFEAGLKRRKAFAYWKRLNQTQWLGRAQIEQIQLEALQRLIAHAVDHCPYYRESWRERGVSPQRLSALADFERWPVIERSTIQQNRLAMQAQVPEMKLLHKATGGSSGVPLQFDYDLDSLDRRMAAWHRGYEWAGAAPGTRQLYLWGVPLGQRSRRQLLKDNLYNRLYGRLVLNSFELSEQSAPQFLDRLNRYKPQVIVAYTNPLYFFARMLRDRGERPWSPRSIVVGAEKLHDFQRELIQEVFGAPVFETYGSREFMLIGAECDRHEGLHLSAEQLLVEVLDDDGRPTRGGEEGNVVVTDLYNYGMPFIRYANGDRAIAGFTECSCGRGLPLLRKVVGRQLDLIQTPDGRRVPGEFFPHLVKDFQAVRQFQVVQEAPDLVRLLVVAPEELGGDDRARLTAEIRHVLGPAVRFEMLRVESIPLTRSGKLQVVVNRCASQVPAPVALELADAQTM